MKNNTIAELGLLTKARLTVGADDWHTAALPRAGIRSMTLCDGPFGVRCEDPETESPDDFNKKNSYPSTCMPCGAAIGASWNEALTERVASAIGREAKNYGVDVILGPAMNHKRTPIGGRNFEYLSEDPLLTGKLAAAYVRGMQKEGVAACVKHYCANNTELNRLTVNIEVEEKVFREIYLKGFEIAVKEGAPYCVMGAYNKIGGRYCCENERLIDGILRREWGFDGVVVSDWRAVHDRAAALNAGCDLEMPFMTKKSAADVVRAVRRNDLPARKLEKSVWRLKRLSILTSERGGKNDFTQNYITAKEMAEESAVLLKNDGVLPISADKKIALVGGRSVSPKFQGSGSARLNALHVTNLYEELKKRVKTVRYAEGFTEGEAKEELLAEAAEAARDADVVVAVLSSPPSDDAEDKDRAGMALEKGAEDLLLRLTAEKKPVVLVLQSGAPVIVPCREKLSAVLETFLAGSGGGEAAAEILTGEVNPSGRLAETYPERCEDNPAAAFYGCEDTVRYGEGLLTGYRYYTTERVRAAYPFGWGLSYTEFTYSDFTAAEEGGRVRLSVEVTNTGNADGREVVQFYAEKQEGVARELVGFAKVYVPAGKSVRATAYADKREFSVWRGAWHIEKENFILRAAKHAEDEGIRTELKLNRTRDEK